MLRRALLLALVCVGGLAASAARAEEPALRKWHLGVQATAGARSTHDVFATPLLPGAAVEKKGRGAGFFLGRRFGDRFLVDLQVTWARHDMASAADDVIDVEALITGTVLFRERDDPLRDVVDALGRPVDGKGPIVSGPRSCELRASPPLAALKSLSGTSPIVEAKAMPWALPSGTWPKICRKCWCSSMLTAYRQQEQLISSSAHVNASAGPYRHVMSWTPPTGMPALSHALVLLRGV